MDPLFRVEVISQSPNPQQVMYAAMHQDYSENFVFDEKPQWPNEEAAGELIVRRLLAGERGHYGPLEHPQIVLNCGYFPHSVMQQARTHRVGISFDVQSGRYTGRRFSNVAAKHSDLLEKWARVETTFLVKELYSMDEEVIEPVFYLRPAGNYTDRKGKKYTYTQEQRRDDIVYCLNAAKRYSRRISEGFSEEHARGLIPFDFRQHFVMSLNVRSFMHFMDLRGKKDAQPEIQQLCELMWPHFEAWVPAVADWYKTNRLHKARLAP